MKRPRVIANFALTADGKISTRNHTPSGFTSAADKRRLQEIRALGDALVVGAGTVAADTMSMRLTPPDLRRERQARGQTPEPLRVIVTNSGRLDPEAKVFQKGGAARVIFSTLHMPSSRRAALAPLADLWLFDSSPLPLSAALGILGADYGVRTLICEGGPTLFRSLLEIGAVDELRLTWAGVIFGGANAPTLTGLPGAFLPHTVRATLREAESGENEIFLTYTLRRSARAAPHQDPG